VARATGTVVPSRNLQVIQHKEGGIVREVLVEKGQTGGRRSQFCPQISGA